MITFYGVSLKFDKRYCYENDFKGSRKSRIFCVKSEAFKSLGLYFDVGVICWCEDLVCASVRHPSRSSGHLSVAVQCVQCCTVAVLHSTVRDIRRGQCPLL